MENGHRQWPDIELTEVSDPEGHTCRYAHVRGTDIYLPSFPDQAKIFQELTKLEARQDDTLVCGYPKCGTHWVWEVAGMLNRGRAEYIPAIKETVMVEAVDGVSLSSLPSPRVLNSHLPPAYLPPYFLDKRVKIIYLLRNPKDVAVSLYNHTYNLLPFYGYDGPWKGYFELFMQGKVDYGNWFSYIKAWDELIESRPDLPVHVIHYEHMKQDPQSEIRRLAAFLGTTDDPELIRQIAEKCSFNKMKVAKSALDGEVEKADWRDGKPMMYRKGLVGDWKNWFTVAQNERFERELERTLSRCKHKFTYVLSTNNVSPKYE